MATIASLGLQHIEARAEAERRATEAEEGRRILDSVTERITKARDALGLAAEERAADLANAVEALEEEARARVHAQELLREQSRVLEAFFKHTITPLVFLDRDFNFLRVNEPYAKACQRDVSEFLGHNHFGLYPHAENEAIFREVVRTKTPFRAVAKPFVFPDHPEWGTTYWDWTLVPILDAAGEVEFLVFSLGDVTERKEAERRDQFTKGLLELFARKASRKEYLDSVVEMVRGWCGCRCVGVRVTDAEGYIPYESVTGFSREFCDAESRLWLQKDTCACVRVIAGTPEPQDAAVTTPGGSFRCDNAAAFVAGLSPGEQARFRGYCARNGFVSIAIIPVRYHGETLGAIHVADEREGMVPPGSVEFLESMSPLIGEAIHRFGVEGKLRSAYSYARAVGGEPRPHADHQPPRRDHRREPGDRADHRRPSRPARRQRFLGLFHRAAKGRRELSEGNLARIPEGLSADDPPCLGPHGGRVV